MKVNKELNHLWDCIKIGLYIKKVDIKIKIVYIKSENERSCLLWMIKFQNIKKTLKKVLLTIY